MISPNRFVNQTYSLSIDYKPKTQQDTQEFIRLFLDDMDRNLQTIVGKSIISECLKGTIECVMKCHGCTARHVKEEELAEISLPVPENQEVIDLPKKSEVLLKEEDKIWHKQQNESIWNKFKE